jgi:hypothetical protein
MHRFLRRKFAFAGSAAALLLAGCTEGLLTEPHAIPSPSLVQAANLNVPAAGHIRIGIVNGATTVRIGGTGDFEIRNKATGALLATAANEDLDVSLGSTVVFYNFLYLQVGCVAEASANDHAVRLAQAGYQSKVVKHATVNCWRVLAGEFPLNTPTSVTDAFRDELVAKGLAPTNAFRSTHSWSEGVQEFQISRGGTQVAVSNEQVVLTPTSGEVRINGRRYRGVAEVLANSGGLAGVNELPLEEYLYGVVPRELPPVPYGEPEAQKAQAVTARTYALANFNKQTQHGFNLTNTTTDQVYGGLQDEHPVSTAAVDATAGIGSPGNPDLHPLPLHQRRLHRQQRGRVRQRGLVPSRRAGRGARARIRERPHHRGVQAARQSDQPARRCGGRLRGGLVALSPLGGGVDGGGDDAGAELHAIFQHPGGNRARHRGGRARGPRAGPQDRLPHRSGNL